MADHFEAKITPEPSDADRDAVLAAVRETLRREAGLARISAWRLSGRVSNRVGITDLGRWMDPARRWPLSSQLGWGGRVFGGLNGRGDAR